MRALLALILSLAALTALPGSVAACSPHVPTFDEVVANARAIVDGRIIDFEDDDAHPQYDPSSVTVAVDRVLVGEADDVVVVDTPTTVCGDGVRVRKGRRVIVALDMPFGGEVIAPYWSMYRGRVYEGGSEETPNVKTLDELAAVIRGLPHTSTAPPRPAAPPVPALLVGALALALFLARPINRRRRAA